MANEEHVELLKQDAFMWNAWRKEFREVQPNLRKAHGMRNELHFRLNGLHRLIQYYRFCLRRDQKYLILMEREGQRKTVKSYFTDELKLVAHPVGLGVSVSTASVWARFDAHVTFVIND